MWKRICQVTHGVRQVVLCKDADGKIGLRVKAVNKGSHLRFWQFYSLLVGEESLYLCRCVCLPGHQGVSGCTWRTPVWRSNPSSGRGQSCWIFLRQGAFLFPENNFLTPLHQVHELLKKAGVNNITMAVRDRPFERTLTLHKVASSSSCWPGWLYDFQSNLPLITQNSSKTCPIS